MVAAQHAPDAEAGGQLAPQLTFDKKSSTPLFVQVKYYVVHLISLGRLGPGAPLPSVRQFARAATIAPTTVQRAYRELEQEGTITGELGRGYFVAARPAPPARPAADHARRLSEALLPAILQARTFGFSDAEILAGARRLLVDAPAIGGAGEPARGSQPRVVVVGRTSPLIDKYAKYLQVRLGDLDVSIEAVDQQHLAAVCDEAEAQQWPISLVIGHAETLGRAQLVARQHGLSVEGLVVDLAAAVKAALASLSPDAHVGLVTEARYLPAALASVPQYRGSYENLTAASSIDHDRLAWVLAHCDPIVHSMQTRDIVRSQAAKTTTTIELEYLPSDGFVDGLRALLKGRPPPANGGC